ncbi:Rho GTPase activating protein with PAK-box/P21-Rho-binding domain-containing protein [Actinidia rufa]|uniref:Rho GTPase activating protein with PAK-box/P21-Rho-binding domain-containing protein n=1 Tax=Actinidia rufa TaxID=165716 RepID=A0A7J0H497_9ERIC|nr:Rho GTPase activating protein with PAK-box/P21-Rho-binding domain-containing protein [Actinidia rufa]
MTEVLHSSPSSSPSSSSLSCAPSSTPNHNDALFLTQEEEEEGDSRVTGGDGDQLSLLALLVTLFRKSFWVACKTEREELCGMEIGWPTNVRHVAHVTFDRFNGFLGLPVEFEPEVPRRAPSASATVFGVSTESMQLSYDPRGNSVPTILLLMQRRLYAQGGLQAEGIFRINAENSQEEYVRDQLNSGVIPEGIDVHCLAGLIKAWFRELPTGVLDPLSPEQVMQCQSEEDCTVLVRLLPPTEAALLDWAINLMADVVQQEHLNKMNAHNVAMVFAPNMTQMADPLTALMYAVQVMNFLKTLIVKTLRHREDSVVEPAPVSRLEPSDENGHDSPSKPRLDTTSQENDEVDPSFITDEPILESASDSNELDNVTDGDARNDSTSIDGLYEDCYSDHFSAEIEAKVINDLKGVVQENSFGGKIGQSSVTNLRKGPGIEQQPVLQVMGHVEKNKEISNLSRINSITERIEAWR